MGKNLAKKSTYIAGRIHWLTICGFPFSLSVFGQKRHQKSTQHLYQNVSVYITRQNIKP
jgi:hypothetical protein